MATLDPNNNRTISQLQQAAALTGTEVIAIVQGGITVRTTAQAIANLGGGGTGTSINGLSGDVLLAAGTDISLSTSGQTITINSTGGGGTITGSGAANQVAWWDGTSVITGDNTFVHDPTPGTGYTIISQDFGGSPDWTGAFRLQSQIFGAGTGAALIQATNNADGSNATIGTGQGGTSGPPYLFGTISVNNAAGAQQQLLIDYTSGGTGTISIEHDKDDGTFSKQSQLYLNDEGIGGYYQISGVSNMSLYVGPAATPDGGTALPGSLLEYTVSNIFSVAGTGDSSLYNGGSNTAFLMTENGTFSTRDTIYTAPGLVNISHDNTLGSLSSQGLIQMQDSEILIQQLGTGGGTSIIQLYGTSTEIGYNSGTLSNITFNTNTITIDPQVGGTVYMSLTNSFINVFGDVQFASYPDSRNDGAATNFLYTDSSGFLKSAPINPLPTVPAANVDYACLPTDSLVLIQSDTASVNVTMPSVIDGLKITIKDALGTSATHNITLLAGSHHINGGTTYTMNTDWQSVTLVYSAALDIWNII